jgi:hypothetical protein
MPVELVKPVQPTCVRAEQRQRVRPATNHDGCLTRGTIVPDPSTKLLPIPDHHDLRPCPLAPALSHDGEIVEDTTEIDLARPPAPEVRVW